jgi:REP element-mobilizing transposase RayT
LFTSLPETVRITPKAPPAAPPTQETDSRPRVVLEQFARRPYDLSYACLLIPRFGTHRLEGDLVEILRSNVYQICVSFGWRLDFIMIRPEFLQWVVSAPATLPPVRSIRTIREQTSKKIFDDFPRFKEENLGSDFWAPPYLVLVGPTPHPPETIIDFIRLTRQEQGLLPRRNH